jgi:hypothetical protein
MSVKGRIRLSDMYTATCGMYGYIENVDDVVDCRSFLADNSSPEL